jgi:hypothetical protein
MVWIMEMFGDKQHKIFRVFKLFMLHLNQMIYGNDYD